MTTEPMRIEVWSDVICPWCYLGKRRFERALSGFEHRAHVTLHWRSFQLDPAAPPSYPGDIHDMLARKYNVSRARAETMHAQMTTLAKQDDLDYRFDLARPGNTRDAHRLVHLAHTLGLADAMQERLMRGYFTEGVAIGERPAISALAVEVGVPEASIDDMFAGDVYVEAVRDDQAQAQNFGIQGVPAFLIDRKYLVSGAQSSEVLTMALQRAWQARHV